jgi:hypothetical protein
MDIMAKRKDSSDLEYIRLVCEHCGKGLDVPSTVTVYCCNSKMQVKDKYAISLKAKI